MKLAACYTVYNGIELLEDAIESIKNNVDEIIICYQTISNRGEKNNDFLNWIKNNKDYNYIEFKPDLNIFVKKNEASKHEMLRLTAKKLGCTHWFLSATDHLYKHNEVENVKKEVIKNKYKTTFTKMKTFFKENYYCLKPLEDYYMPFICDVNIPIKYQGWSPVKVDSAIKFDSHNNYKVFDKSEILMYHYSYVRYDIENKLINAAARSNWRTQIPSMLDQFRNFKEGDKFYMFNKYDIVKCNPDFELKNYYKNEKNIHNRVC